MVQKESFWSRVNHFLYNHLLLIVIVVATGWWLWNGWGRTAPLYSFATGGAREEAAMDMDMAMGYGESSPVAMRKMAQSNYGIVPPMPMNDGFIPNTEDRKIIKNASLEVEVVDTEVAKKDAESWITEVKGSITNLNSWEVRPGVLAYNMTARIPAGELESTMARLTGLGVKKSENFNTSDITAQYMDTKARLENLHARRDRLRAMMDQKTDKLGDVLEIDRELSNVQMEIENLEQTQTYRDTDVSYSTLQLSLQPEQQIGDVQNPYWSATKSWRTAVNDLIMSAQKIADRLMKAVVYIPIWLPILLIFWWVDRKFLKRRK